MTQQSGTCTIRASQAGNANYTAAPSADRSITIGVPPPPSAPSGLVCYSLSVNTIDCTWGASSSISSDNPILSYRLYCANQGSANEAQTSVNVPLLRARFNGVSTGVSRCNVNAQGKLNASDSSNIVSVSVSAIPLALRSQIDFDGTGFATLLLRGSAATGDAATEDAGASAGGVGKLVGTRTVIGRFDGTRFVFTDTNDAGLGWDVLGTGDINGSGRVSLIARNTDDDVRVDARTDANAINTKILRRAKRDWQLEAVADLDGNGRADMLWRYTLAGSPDAGVIFAWYMTSDEAFVPSVVDIRRRGGAPLNWDVLGAADVNGDGRADVLWRSPTGEVRVQYSQADRTWRTQTLGNLPAGYQVLKVADFNGDGIADLLLADDKGGVRIWLLGKDGDSTRVALDVAMPTLAPGLRYVAAGDYDGSGTTDIVWRRADGTLTLWLMNAPILNQPRVIEDAGKLAAGLLALDM